MCDQLGNRDSLFNDFQIKTAVSGIQWYKPEGSSTIPYKYFRPRQNGDGSELYETATFGALPLSMGTNRKDRIRGYEAMGTKSKDRVRGYEGNDSEMYSQWYEKYDDNSTQKIRTDPRISSKDDDYLQGGKGRDKLRGGKGDDVSC